MAQKATEMQAPKPCTNLPKVDAAVLSEHLTRNGQDPQEWRSLIDHFNDKRTIRRTHFYGEHIAEWVAVVQKCGDLYVALCEGTRYEEIAHGSRDIFSGVERYTFVVASDGSSVRRSPKDVYCHKTSSVLDRWHACYGAIDSAWVDDGGNFIVLLVGKPLNDMRDPKGPPYIGQVVLPPSER